MGTFGISATDGTWALIDAFGDSNARKYSISKRDVWRIALETYSDLDAFPGTTGYMTDGRTRATGVQERDRFELWPPDLEAKLAQQAGRVRIPTKAGRGHLKVSELGRLALVHAAKFGTPPLDRALAAASTDRPRRHWPQTPISLAGVRYGAYTSPYTLQATADGTALPWNY